MLRGFLECADAVAVGGSAWCPRAVEKGYRPGVRNACKTCGLDLAHRDNCLPIWAPVAGRLVLLAVAVRLPLVLWGDLKIFEFIDGPARP